jgi:hypothetical protein
MMNFLIIKEILGQKDLPKFYNTIKLWVDKYCSNRVSSQKFINKMECLLKLPLFFPKEIVYQDKREIDAENTESEMNLDLGS